MVTDGTEKLALRHVIDEEDATRDRLVGCLREDSVFLAPSIVGSPGDIHFFTCDLHDGRLAKLLNEQLFLPCLPDRGSFLGLRGCYFAGHGAARKAIFLARVPVSFSKRSQMTAQYVGSISTMRQRRLACSAASSVEPDPPNGS